MTAVASLATASEGAVAVTVAQVPLLVRQLEQG